MKALIHSWLSKFPESEQQVLSGYIEDYFYRALDWVLKQVMSILTVFSLNLFDELPNFMFT